MQWQGLHYRVGYHPGINANAMTVNAANLRSAIPQVQVIPQMQGTPYMQYPFNQQQIMLQNAAAMQAAMQANAMNMNISPQLNMANMNMAAMMQQQRMGVNAGLMSPGPATGSQNSGITFTPLQAQVSATVTSTTNAKALSVSKGQTTPSTPTQQASATALIGGKPIMPTQPNIAAQPLVLSVLPNQLTSSGGFVGSIALSQGTPAQLISTQAPIRFSQPQLVSSTGQINIQSQPIMTNQSILQAMATQLQHGAIPLGHQPLQLSASGQSPTILPGQPVYIRTTQIQGQQGVQINKQTNQVSLFTQSKRSLPESIPPLSASLRLQRCQVHLKTQKDDLELSTGCRCHDSFSFNQYCSFSTIPV